LNALSAEPIQRYRCAAYGHRFSQHLNSNLGNKRHSHVSANIGAKNMASTQKTKICAERVKTTPTENEIKAIPQIEKLLVQLTNDGKSKTTIKNYRIYLNLLLRNGA
jgi:hypothetical protein